MGRSGYDTTYVCNDKNSAAADVVAMANHQRAQDAQALERAAAAAFEAKLIKNKRSRGIKAAQKAGTTGAAKDKAATALLAAAAAAAAQTGTKTSGTEPGR